MVNQVKNRLKEVDEKCISSTPVKLYLDTERSMELSGLDAYGDLRENT